MRLFEKTTHKMALITVALFACATFGARTAQAAARITQTRSDLLPTVSGYAEEAFAKSLPPNDDRKQFSFLPKPFTLKQLVGAVKEAMQE